MATTTVELRCPACGQELRAVVTPSPPTQWFPCPHCRSPVPVLAPRELPPLYSWEVLPGLYPALPRPHVPRWRARRVAAAGLIAIVILAVAFGGVLTYLALAAPAPGHYSVTGVVYRTTSGGFLTTATGARVALTEDGGSTTSVITDSSGTFAFSGVPTGGITLNVRLVGYDPATVNTFASPVYDAGTTGISVTLAPLGSGNSTNVTMSPFTDLENFLASIGTGVALLGVVAAVAAAAAVLTLRSDRPALGVVGGGAGVAAPLALYLLGLGIAFPEVVAGTALLAAVGAFTLALRAIEIGQTSPAPGSD